MPLGSRAMGVEGLVASVRVLIVNSAFCELSGRRDAKDLPRRAHNTLAGLTVSPQMFSISPLG
jgi:hypothetical protein